MHEGVAGRLEALEASFRQCRPGRASSSGSSSASSSGSGSGSGGATLQAYVSFICTNLVDLAGVQLLSMAACCLFGLRPPSPLLEKLYVTELMLWGQAVTTQHAHMPHGPEGAQWALVSAAWWDRWR